MGELPLLKVVLLGDGGVGKTSLARRFCEGKFDNSRLMTIGVDFQTKIIELPAGQVKLSIWDLAGQARFQSIREGFYRGSLAAALVYELGNLDTLRSLGNWYREAIKNAPDIKLILVGNKADLVKGQDWEGEKLGGLLRVPYFRTSAAHGDGVEEMFHELGEIAHSQFLFLRNNSKTHSI